MHNNKIKFKIGEIVIETTECDKYLIKAAQKLFNLLKNFEYNGSLREKNSRQLDMHFDESILNKFKTLKWNYSVAPYVDMPALGEDWGNPKADFIISPTNINGYRIVIEIEKANKKTIWFDFIKLWMFIETKQAEAGVLLCPVNYSHTHGTWNLFDEACRYKRYLGRFAGVAKEKLNLIAIVGYKQMIKSGTKYTLWNEKEFNKIKKSA